MKILITGGCGFVGSSLALMIRKKFPKYNILAVDNFYRKGSLINKKRLLDQNIKVEKLDIRYKKNFNKISKFDFLIDCAADPSVQSGIKDGLSYLFETNLNGTLNCLELVKKYNAKIIFISTSRVYPFKDINNLKFSEQKNELTPHSNKGIKGFNDKKGFSEKFELKGLKTFYGFTKYSSENLIKEYCSVFNLKYIINRSGVIAGPWQWGKVDQGFVVHWLLNYYKNNKLSYIGFNGKGSQIRDILNISDFCNVVLNQITNFSTFENDIYNLGGGIKNKTSLFNLNNLCEKIYKKKMLIKKVKKNRYGDIPYYVSDNSKIIKILGWKPKISVDQTVYEINSWIKSNINLINKIL